ncbi:MAG: C25 family cysteine peptidase, partial [bacterium]
NRLIAIPYGAEYRIEVDAVQTRIIDLADYGVQHLLLPAQPSMPKNADPATFPFEIDRSAYETDKVSRDLVRVVPQGRLRAMDLGRVEVAPVEYFPRTNQIRLTECIDFRVVFEGADKSGGDELMARTASPFYDHLYAYAANSKAYQDAYPDRVGDVVTMVIVTPPEFEAQLADFVTWKTERGFHMEVGVIGSGAVGSTTTSIQAYIHDLYNNPPAGQPAPSFVLFVGDVAQCPTFQMSGDPSDRPYCAVDGDLVPDIYYGRFSATNSSQLQAILDKTMIYDQYTMTDPSYLNEVVMIAGMDSGYGSTHGNGQINYGTSNYFNAAHGLTSHTYLYPNSGSNSSQIVSNVSNGVAYINYTAHGSQTSWSDPSFTQSNINSLGNSGQYCMAVGNCCLTSTYDYAECFAETWLRAADKGAIGYIGGSNSTYWDEDFWWGVGACPSGSIGPNPTYAGTGLGAYDGVFHDHGEADHLWYVTNDALVFAGNLAVMEAGGMTTYYWNIYNLMGDPSLSTFMGVPAANSVGYSNVSSAGITISADIGSYVGVTENGSLLGAGTVNASGSVDITFSTTPTTGSIHLVVMAQNRVPYITDIALASPELSLSATAFSNSMGPDATESQYLEISNIGEAGSILAYSIGIQAEQPPAKGDEKSIAGSTLTCSESEYLAGTTVDLVFSVYNASSDLEWLTDVTIDFPAGVTVNSSTAFIGGSSPMNSDNATGDGVLVSWHGTSSGWGVIHGGETATSTVNVSYGGGLAGDIDFDWFLQGDIYGSTPHDLAGTITLTASGPSITVTAPNGGEVLAIEAGQTITWDSAGGVGDVKIDLSRNSGSSWEPISSGTSNDGSYAWKVTGPASTECLIRVSTLDDSVSDTSDDPFTIFQPVNWLTVNPVSGSLGQGDSQLLELAYDTAGMAPGLYQAFIVIDHSAGNDPAVVTVDLEIIDGMSAVGDTPLALGLTGNYPNPFNPQTVVSFSVAKAGPVSINVLDIRGYHVRTLVTESFPAGQHQVTWNGLDDAGHAVASGLYFAVLRMQGEADTHKMMLAR